MEDELESEELSELDGSLESEELLTFGSLDEDSKGVDEPLDQLGRLGSDELLGMDELLEELEGSVDDEELLSAELLLDDLSDELDHDES